MQGGGRAGGEQREGSARGGQGDCRGRMEGGQGEGGGRAGAEQGKQRESWLTVAGWRRGGPWEFRVCPGSEFRGRRWLS